MNRFLIIFARVVCTNVSSLRPLTSIPSCLLPFPLLRLPPPSPIVESFHHRDILHRASVATYFDPISRRRRGTVIREKSYLNRVLRRGEGEVRGKDFGPTKKHPLSWLSSKRAGSRQITRRQGTKLINDACRTARYKRWLSLSVIHVAAAPSTQPGPRYRSCYLIS